MIQAFLICSLCFIASAIYVWMQFLPIAPFMIVMAQFFWQASHGKNLLYPISLFKTKFSGGAVFIYLIFNKSLRRNMLKLILPASVGAKLGKSTNAVTDTANTRPTDVSVPSVVNTVDRGQPLPPLRNVPPLPIVPLGASLYSR